MADATTAHYGWTKPEVGASPDTWGGKLNTDLDGIDAALKAVSDRATVTNMIVLWYGAAADCPNGWAICDGTGGTPDLRGRFPIGADADSGGSYNKGATGGAATATVTVASHTLTTGEIPAHSHGVTDPGHGHGVSDPQHGHGVTDPGHAHTYYLGSASVLGGPNFINGGAINNGPFATSSDATGISIDGASTGLSVNDDTTGVVIQDAGGGGGHSHSATQDTNLPPYRALWFIMKLA